MRYTFDEIEEFSHMIKNDKWVGYPNHLFSNLLEYTCPELLKFKYIKLDGFSCYGEREFISITDKFFSQVKLRENLSVTEFGVYRRAIGFVYKDDLHVITPSENDLVIIYIINKETRARRVYRDIHKSKVLDFIEGKYIQEKSDRDFGFIGCLIEYEVMQNMGYPKIEDLYVIYVQDVDSYKDRGGRKVFAHLPHDEEEGVEIYYEENWRDASHVTLEELGHYYKDDDWDEEDEWE